MSLSGFRCQPFAGWAAAPQTERLSRAFSGYFDDINSMLSLPEFTETPPLLTPDEAGELKVMAARPISPFGDDSSSSSSDTADAAVAAATPAELLVARDCQFELRNRHIGLLPASRCLADATDAAVISEVDTLGVDWAQYREARHCNSDQIRLVFYFPDSPLTSAVTAEQGVLIDLLVRSVAARMPRVRISWEKRRILGRVLDSERVQSLSAIEVDAKTGRSSRYCYRWGPRTAASELARGKIGLSTLDRAIAFSAAGLGEILVCVWDSKTLLSAYDRLVAPGAALELDSADPASAAAKETGSGLSLESRLRHAFRCSLSREDGDGYIPAILDVVCGDSAAQIAAAFDQLRQRATPQRWCWDRCFAHVVEKVDHSDRAAWTAAYVKQRAPWSLASDALVDLVDEIVGRRTSLLGDSNFSAVAPDAPAATGAVGIDVKSERPFVHAARRKIGVVASPPKAEGKQEKPTSGTTRHGRWYYAWVPASAAPASAPAPASTAAAAAEPKPKPRPKPKEKPVKTPKATAVAPADKDGFITPEKKEPADGVVKSRKRQGRPVRPRMDEGDMAFKRRKYDFDKRRRLEEGSTDVHRAAVGGS